jgi:hypothetical protein
MIKVKSIRNKNQAVSEVIGTILLLGISVTIFSVVYTSFLSVDAQPPAPTVDIMGTVHENYLILEHGGGEDVDLDFRIIVRYHNLQDINPDSSPDMTEVLVYRDVIDNGIGNNGKWNIGEKLVFNLSSLDKYSQFQPIDIMVVDSQSNSAVMMGTLKESPVPAEPPKFANVGIADIYCTPDTVSENASDVTLYFTVENYGDKPATGFNYTILIEGTEFAVDVSHDFSSQQTEADVAVLITLPDSYPQNMPSYNITVEISQYDSDGPDEDLTNNIETTWVDFFEEEQYIPEADLSINIRQSPAMGISFYDPLFFNVGVKNDGPDSINNVCVQWAELLPNSILYKSIRPSQGTYDVDTDKWTIGSLDNDQIVRLDINAFMEPLPSEVGFTQFAIVIDGSNTITTENFLTIREGIANAILDGSIPRNGQIELTVIQFGQTSNPIYPTIVELPPTILNNIQGSEGYYQTVANTILTIKKMGGQISPFSQALQRTTETLLSSPNFNSNNIQIINLITDGQMFNLVPGGGRQCFEIEGTVICFLDDDIYPPDEGTNEDVSDIIEKRNEMIQLLGLNQLQDQINVLAIEGQLGLNLGWLQNQFVWPQPGYDNWLPTGPGWIRIVDTSLKVRNCLGYQINYIPQARTVTAEIISYSGADDPDDSNNFYSLTITPQKRKFT